MPPKEPSLFPTVAEETCQRIIKACDEETERNKKHKKLVHSVSIKNT